MDVGKASSYAHGGARPLLEECSFVRDGHVEDGRFGLPGTIKSSPKCFTKDRGAGGQPVV